MKRTYYLTIAVLLSLFTGGLSSCVSDDNGLGGSNTDPNPDSDKLVINYRIDQPQEVITYGATGTEVQDSHECNIDQIITFFFHPDDGTSNANKFAGYTETGIVTTASDKTTRSGTISVTLPGNLTPNDDMQLIVLANYKDYQSLPTPWNTMKEYVENIIKTKTYQEVKEEEFKIYLKDNQYFTVSRLPMSACYVKNMATPEVNVTFTRRVARIDVKNSVGDIIAANPEDNTINRFELRSVRLYNANRNGYMTNDNIMAYMNTAEGSHINYGNDPIFKVNEGQDQVIQAAIYALPNFVNPPSMKDDQTTCLIIGGLYNKNTKESYYRINVNPKTQQQLLSPNGLYTINITKVTDKGSDSPGGAFKDNNLDLEYTINEWDDNLLLDYIFDINGNALSVSQRQVSFSNKKDQELTIKVFTKESKTNPIAADWTISLEGDDASSFEILSEDKTQPTGSFTIKTKEDNTSMLDKVATAKLSWGDIVINISLIQLSPYSTLKGITVFPKDLIVENKKSTRKLGVNTQGNFDGLDISHITHSIMYSDDSNTGWITDVRPSAPQTQLDQGIYYFDVDIEAQGANAESRTAIIKFVVRNGKHIASAEASITQSPTKVPQETHETLTIDMYLYNKEPQAGQQPAYVEKKRSDIVGLSPVLASWSADNTLLFSQAPADQIYYNLHITSDFDWQIETDKNTGTNLKFDIVSIDDPSGNTKTTTLKVSAAKEAPHAWAGSFKIKYEDGTVRTFYAAQEGVYRQFTDATDSPVHFYGIITYRNQLWLDRNLGDLESSKYDGKIYVSTKEPWYSQNTRVKLSNLIRNCPPGWRLPRPADAIQFVEDIRLNTDGTLQVLTSLPTSDTGTDANAKYYDLVRHAQYLSGANYVKWYGTTQTDTKGVASSTTVTLATEEKSTFAHLLFDSDGKRKIWTTTKLISTISGGAGALTDQGFNGASRNTEVAATFHAARHGLTGTSWSEANTVQVRCIREKITEQP